MKNKVDKKILKEEEGLSTPKPINRYTESDIESTIKGVLEKEFKDFTLKTYQHQGETEYINLIICSEIEDLNKDLELKRYVISRTISEFRRSFLTELSKYLNVVNVNCGSYSFVKGTDKITFTVTILLSDNNISDWVSGNRKKVESNKEFVKKSKNTMKNSVTEIKAIRNVLTNLYESVLKEGKVTKSFETKKDEFEIKESLAKKGLKASVEKAGVVRVTYNDKKYNEDEIKKLMESKEMQNVKVILESIYKQILTEARPKKKIEVEPEVESEPQQKIDTKSERKLQKAIREYAALSNEIEELEEQHRKFMQKRNDKQTKLEEVIYSTMKSVNMNLYIVDEIVAKLSAEFERENTKYAKMFEELLTKVNDDTKKVIHKLKKKYTSTTTVYSRLDVQPPAYPRGKGKRNESLIKESFVSWFKDVFSILKGYLSSLTASRKKLQELAHEVNLI